MRLAAHGILDARAGDAHDAVAKGTKVHTWRGGDEVPRRAGIVH
jgi:hypothetical protein